MSGTLLSFGAHPDDIEIGCGGTELRLIQLGFKAHHAYLTSGEAGSRDIPAETLLKTREREAQEAARFIGADSVTFLRERDGFINTSENALIQVIGLIRKVRPGVIFVHSSSDTFSDHLMTHKLVLAAATLAAGPCFQQAKGEPWQTKTILGYEVWHPLNQHQLAVDITTTLDRKIAAIECFRSQVSETRYHEAFRGLARYRGVMSYTGTYAEVFEVIKMGPFPL